MIPLPLEEVTRRLGMPRRPGTVTGLCTDSRRVQPGDCFVALRGRRVDARRFIPGALEGGAVLAVGGPGTTPGERVVAVEDPREALGRIASLVRDRYTGPVVGITGTVGKTTVKEFLRTLVEPTRRGVFPEASFNNLEGVSRTLARLEKDTELLVVEIGTSSRGEVAGLCALARPTLGVLTAVGPAHLDGLGTVDGVLEEKMDLARSLPRGARLLVNGDDPVLAGTTYPRHVEVVRVALGPRPGVRAPVGPWNEGTLRLPEGPAIPHPFRSRARVLNLWIALNVARELDIPGTELLRAASALRAPPMRGETRQIGGTSVVLDCYNANPLSMDEALRTLAERDGRRVAVLGEMLELGDQTRRHHRELGRLFGALGLDHVIFMGPSWEAVGEGAREVGLAPTGFQVFRDLDAARPSFRELLAAGGTLLLKASRGMALERLLEDLP